MRRPFRLEIRKSVQVLTALLLLSALGATVAPATCPHSPDILCGFSCQRWIGNYRICQLDADLSRFCIEVLGSGGCIQGYNHCSCADFPGF
jgi:hypothetical protein